MTEREFIKRQLTRYWLRTIAKAGSVARAAKVAGRPRQNAYVIVRRLGLGDLISKKTARRGKWERQCQP